MILEKLTGLMIEYFRDPRRIEHALKVYAYARGIGGEEGLGEEDMLLLGAAGLLHDIGAPSAKEKYGISTGRYQEEEGALVAPTLLAKVSFPAEATERVAWLVGHHHTEELAGTDRLLLILMEADYLVNLVEGNWPDRQPREVYETFFRTATGKRYLAALFGL